MHFPPPRSNAPGRAPGTPPAPARPTRHARPSIRRRPRWGIRIGLVVALLGSVAGAAFAASERYLPGGAVLPGLTIDGAVVAGPEPRDVVTHVEARAEELLGRRVRLVVEGVEAPVSEATLAELGVRVDVDRTVATARRVGRGGDLLTRAETARDARDGRLDVPLFTRVERDVAMQRLLAMKETVDTQPVSARLDLERHETVSEKDGRYVDADGAIALLEAAARRRELTSTIVLPVKTFKPRVSSAFLKSLDVSTVVAEYETSFSRSGEQRRRGKNIDIASQRLDGLVISPGEVLSFNQIVGERSEANGFQKSWEIFKGEMVEGVGGGTCQVSSTFYAASFFGGFEVLERLGHSRPSAYIPMGLDSTVVYPGVDLKVRNPHPFPVVVHATTRGSKLHIELLGKTRPVNVSFGREVLSTIPYKRKVEEDPVLRGTKVLVKQHGIKGFKIKITRQLRYADGTARKEEREDTYPPTTEIYKVPVGFDVALLPPLPSSDDEEPELAAPPPVDPVAPASSDASGAVAAAPAAVELVDAPGAHAPTSAQKEPPKKLWMSR